VAGAFATVRNASRLLPVTKLLDEARSFMLDEERNARSTDKQHRSKVLSKVDARSC
jgi:hypothetical protein